MAGAISFNGIGSGLDFNKLTEAIIAERTRPVSQLQIKSATFSQRSEALKQLNGKLVALTEASRALNDDRVSAGREALSSEVEVVSAKAAGGAVTGVIKLNITRLASSLTQISRPYTATSSAILTGSATTATFELRRGGAGSGKQITITTENNSLNGLREAINTANAGVTASIVDEDGSGLKNRLILSSSSTGVAGRVELVETTATGTGADLGLTTIGLPGGLTELDAQFSLNGLTLTRSGNTISDALSGVTFELKKSGTATVTISEKNSELTQRLQNFVNAYNDVQDYIASQYVRDGRGRPGGALAGDSTLRAVQQTLRDGINRETGADGGKLTRLTQLGLGRDENGKLTLDTKVVEEKLAQSFDDVKALLTGKGTDNKGIADLLTESYSRLSDAGAGVVQTAIRGYQDSIRRLDKNVAEQLARINTLRASLSKQFAAADAAINQINSQGTQLTNIFGAQKKNS